jgi:hypothetical protein
MARICREIAGGYLLKRFSHAGFVDVRTVNATDGGSPRGMTPWKEYAVAATKPWNIALDATQANMQFVPMSDDQVLPKQPFDPAAAPVHIKARGRLLPEWKMLNFSASPPPMSPVRSTQPWQDLMFVPFGSSNIRMAQLPTLGPVEEEGDNIFVN